MNERELSLEQNEKIMITNELIHSKSYIPLTMCQEVCTNEVKSVKILKNKMFCSNIKQNAENKLKFTESVKILHNKM
jgi:hypothetical protein